MLNDYFMSLPLENLNIYYNNTLKNSSLGSIYFYKYLVSQPVLNMALGLVFTVIYLHREKETGEKVWY